MTEQRRNKDSEMMSDHSSLQGDHSSFRYQQELGGQNDCLSLNEPSAFSNSTNSVTVQKRGRGRPRKTTCNNHMVLNISKAIKKRCHWPRKSTQLEVHPVKLGGQIPCKRDNVHGKRKLEESACFPDTKRIRSNEFSEIGNHVEPEVQEPNFTIFLDTAGSADVVPPKICRWPEKEEMHQDANLSMPIIDCNWGNYENSLKENHNVRTLSEQDFIPFSSEGNDQSNNNCELNDVQEVSNLNVVQAENTVYDVLPWCTEMDDPRPGMVIPASNSNGTLYDLLYQFTIDAGRFLVEASGLKIYVFTESCPAPANKSPLALFIQMSNGHLLRIKCQHSNLNLSLPKPDGRQITSSCNDPVYCSTPRPHDYRMELVVKEANISNIQDKRILKIQKEWSTFVHSTSNIYPEITDERWQPFVKLTRQNIISFKGSYSSSKDHDYSDDSGGDRNTKYPMSKSRFENVKCNTSPRNSERLSHTSNSGRTYKCTEGCPGHMLIHRKISPPLSICEEELHIFHIVRILETFSLSDIMDVVHRDMQRRDPQMHKNNNLQYFHTGKYTPHFSRNGKFKTTQGLQESSDQAIILEKTYRRAASEKENEINAFKGFSTSKRYSKSTKLCNFLLPKKPRKTIKRMKKKHKVEDLCESTLIKKKGFTIRLWENYDKNLLQSEGTQLYKCHVCKKKYLNAAALRKHKETQPLCRLQAKQSTAHKEHHFCQLCQISVRSLGSLRSHSCSQGHRRMVKEKIQSCCGILSSVSGLRVEPDEEKESSMEVIEIVEEKIVVEDAGGESSQDENTCTAVTYIYTNPTINAVEKLCLQSDQIAEMTPIPLSQYLKTCEEKTEASESQPCSWNLEEEEEHYLSSKEEDFYASHQNDVGDQVGSRDMVWKKRERDETDVDSAKKRSRTIFSGRQRKPKWLEEELTSDLGSHQPWYLKGKNQKKKHVLGEIIHVKRTFKNHERRHVPNNVWKVFWPTQEKPASDESLCRCDLHDSGVCCNSGQSPYYPHPLLGQIEELYKDTSPSRVEESRRTKKFESYKGQIPHELYDKSGYYIDLDRPTEYYNFNVDSEGKFVTTSELSQIKFGNASLTDREVFVDEQQSDSFSRDLDALKIIKDIEKEYTDVPGFSCRAASSYSKTEDDLNTPQMTPIHEIDVQQSLFKDWTLNFTTSGFDSDFERLWNESY